MATLYYFVPELELKLLVPDQERFDRRLLTKVSADLASILADVRGAADASLFELNGKATPAGTLPGVYIAPLDPQGEPPRLVGYHPEAQQWRSSPCGRYWVGHDLHTPVTPEALRRRSPLVAGYEVELAGQMWQVPIVRRPPNATNLPRQIEFDPHGKIAETIDPRYTALWDEAGVFCDTVFGQRDNSDAEDTRWFQLALDCLAVNYRVGRSTQNQLHLLNSQTRDEVLLAAIDWPWFERVLAEKKRESAAATPALATG